MAAVDATPSPEAKPWLPTASRYHLTLGRGGELGALITTADGRIWGRVYLDAAPTMPSGLHLDFEREGHGDLALDARGDAGVVDGALQGDAMNVTWRAELAADGSLAARRWSATNTTVGCDDIRRALLVTQDLERLAPALARAPSLTPTQRDALGERLSLATLALELSARACERRGRASLPALTGPFAWR